MSNTQPVDEPVDDSRKIDPVTLALVALCLLAAGTILVTTAVWVIWGLPAGIGILGVLLLSGGIALGLST